MRDWLDSLIRAIVPPARPQRPAAPRPARPAPPARSWQAELLAEADFAWQAAGAAAAELGAGAGADVGADAGTDAGAPIAGAMHPEAVPGAIAPWVAPRTDQPREAFTRLGYEPGKRPPSLKALEDLFKRVYDPCLAPVANRVLADLALYAAIDGWAAAAPDERGARLHVVFRQLSEVLGNALAFEPARLGRVDKHRRYGGFYDHGEQAIFLATSNLAAHPARVVNTIAHEQAHRLQHLLIQRLVYAPRKLSPAERSLALYWHEEGTAEPGADYARYRYNGREFHADATAKAVVRALMPVFGWGPEVLTY